MNAPTLRLAVGGLAVLSALAVLGAVLWLGPVTLDGQVTAHRILGVAKTHAGQDIAASVAAELPEGARAWVGVPSVGGAVGGTAPRVSQPNQQGPPVSVLHGANTRAATVDQISRSQAVVTAVDPQGWWVAVTVPSAGSAVPAGVAAALTAGLAAAAAGALGMLRPQPGPHRVAAATAPVPVAAPPRPAAARTPDPPPPSDSRLRLLTDQRGTLIRGLADLIPQLPDAAAWQASNVLAAAGVQVVAPDGERFDPRHHHVVGTETTSNPRLIDTVARTVRAGYADGDGIVVHPRVVVYAAGPGTQEVVP